MEEGGLGRHRPPPGHEPAPPGQGRLGHSDLPVLTRMLLLRRKAGRGCAGDTGGGDGRGGGDGGAGLAEILHGTA